MKRVTVIGALEPPVHLPPASLVVGPERFLSHLDTEAEKIVLGSVSTALERIAAHDGDVVVIASGDPGFFGIVRVLREAGIDPVVHPVVSSVAAAFARVGLAWDDAVVVSAHGRDLRPAVNVCRAFPKVAVLTGPDAGPAELGAALAGVRRRLVVAENLGMPDERMSTVDATDAGREWAPLNVVLVLDPTHPPHFAKGWIAGTQPGPAGWALPESAFAHRDSMITKSEVRALILARLGPRVGDLVWDIGAGSGSVSVECARFGAAVIAVDRDPAFVAGNASGVSGVQVVAGAAPGCLEGLPDPDAVFVGGGGPEVLAACAQRRPRRIVAAFAAIERVGPSLQILEKAGYAAEGVQLQASRLAALPDGSHRQAALNPVFVVSGVLP
jgi:precorrin-6Y C5,15-methyltransferase (decarboxylating)